MFRVSAPLMMTRTSSRTDSTVGITPSRDSPLAKITLRESSAITTCTAATAYGAMRSIRSPAPASAISSPTNNVGTRKSDALTTIPLQEISATHPARQPSRGGPGRQSRAAIELGIQEVIAPAPTRRRPGHRRVRGWSPSTRRRATQRWQVGSRRPPGVQVDTSRTTACAEAPAVASPARKLRSSSPRWPSTASSIPPWWDSSTQPVESRSSRVIRIRARRSSCSDSVAPWADWCQPCADECPVALTSRTSKSSATRLRMIDAAARTAVSIDESTP